MKKILSVALSTAMAFSMFASVAFGETATATPQQAFDALAAKGILNGYPDGQAHLEKDLTRAEFAKIVTKLFGLTEVTGKLTYKDKGYTATNWAVPYIEAVTAANLMQGKDTVKGIFDYNGKVTVEEVAAVLFRALKLETPAATDNSASAWAKGYAQAVINAGLVAQTTNFKANATRSLVVSTAYAVDQLSVKPTLTVASAEAVSPTSVVVTFSDKTTQTVTLTTALVEGVETTISFKHLEKDYTAKVTLAAPKVVAVEAPNAKQLVVKFNRAVSASTLKTDNEKLKNDVVKVISLDNQNVTANGASVSLNAAGTEATINFDVNENEFLKGRYTVLVSDAVKTDAGTAFTSFTTLLTVADTTAPSVVTVNAVAKSTTNKVFVKFSEPVKSLGIIASVNGVSASVYRESADTFSLTAGTLNTGTAYDVSLMNVTDFAGNVAAPIKTSVTVTSDTAAPSIVSVTTSSDKFLIVKFNKKVNAQSLSNNVTLYKADGDRVGLLQLRTEADSDTIKFEVPSIFSFPSSGTFTGSITLGASVRDTLGNTLGATVSQPVSLVKDTVAPAVASAVYGSTGLVVTFNEDVLYVGTGTITLIDNATGQYVDGVKANFSAPKVDGAKVTFPNVSGLSGTYTLRLPAELVKDVSFSGNKSAAATVSVTAAATTTSDSEKPTVAISTYTEGTPSSKEIIYTVNATDNVSLNVATLIDVNSYTLGSKALPSGSYVVVTSSSPAASSSPKSATVEVHIPKTGISKTEPTAFVVFGVADTAGNFANAIARTETLKDGVAPVLTAAAVNSGTSSILTLTFSEDVTGVDAADFDVTINGNIATVKGQEAGKGSDAGKWYLTFTDYADLNANNVNTIKIKVRDNADIVDAAGNKITTGTEIVVR